MGTAKPESRRGGFTLIELLVVMSIIVVVATLAVLFVPSIMKQEKANRGADQLAGWLLIAKQQAKRDQVPTGVRLIATDPTNPTLIKELQYVQQPDPFTVGQCLGTSTSGPPNNTPINPVNFAGVDFTGGVANPATDASVLPGDYLEVAGGGPVHRILGLASTNQLTIQPDASGVVPAVPASSNYRILRQPVPLPGSEPLRLPADVAIDIDPSRSNPPGRVVGGVPVYEILFSPAGGVIGQGTSGDRIYLWVRDVTRDTVFEGGPVLVTTQVRTGLIGAYPVDPPPSTDPFSFAKSNRASGM